MLLFLLTAGFEICNCLYLREQFGLLSSHCDNNKMKFLSRTSRKSSKGFWIQSVPYIHLFV